MKKHTILSAGLGCIAISAIIYGFNTSSEAGSGDLDDWSKDSQKAVETMTEKYGKATEKTSTMMVWHNAGPWKKTIIHAKAVDHNFPKPHKDVIQQYIDYKVPVDKFSKLAEYDGSVVCERTNGQMSATCGKEDMNFLALNLANDIITGKRDVNEAREFYAKTVARHMKGDKDPYTQKFLFTVPKGDTGDPDKMAEMGDMMKGAMSKDGDQKQK